MDTTIKIEVGHTLLVGGNVVPTEKIEIAINTKSGDVQIAVILTDSLKTFSEAIQIQPNGVRPILVVPVGFLERNSKSLALTTANYTERWILLEYVKSCASKLR
jgi:hypothetical protein